MKATKSAKAVDAKGKKAGKAKLHQSIPQWAKQSAVAFGLAMGESDTLAMYAFRYKAARLEARETVKMAHADIGDGAPWQEYLALFAAELVDAKVCTDKESAGRLIRNNLIALKLTGRGTKRGGRKAKTATGEATNVTDDSPSIIVEALAYVDRMQTKHAGDGDLLEDWGGLAAILGKRRKARKAKTVKAAPIEA